MICEIFCFAIQKSIMRSFCPSQAKQTNVYFPNCYCFQLLCDGMFNLVNEQCQMSVLTRNVIEEQLIFVIFLFFLNNQVLFLKSSPKNHAMHLTYFLNGKLYFVRKFMQHYII